MSGYQGNIIIKNPATPAGPYKDGAAPGVWTLSEAMTFVKQGVWPTAGLVESDPYFKNVFLLLHGNGTNGAQNNTFIDSSANGLTITRNGNTTQGSFSPYGSNWSNYFDGSGDSLSGASWSSAGNFGTGDFTIEGWFYAVSAPQNNNVIWSCNIYPNSTGLYLRYFGGSSTELDVRYGTTAIVTASGGWSFNEWHHVAVVRSSGSLTLYIDGVSRGSASFTNNCTDGLQYIGRPSDTSNYAFHGYVSNFRIVKGTAVYTSTFTPSTSPLTAISGTSLLTCQGNRFIDASSNNFTITRNGDTKVVNFAPFAPSVAYTTTINGGSAYLDGSQDHLDAANNPGFDQTGAFTVEMWVYITGGNVFNYTYLYSQTVSNFFCLILDENEKVGIDKLDSGVVIRSASAIPRFAWTHIAMVSNGSNITLYVNGVSQGSTAVGTTVTSTRVVRIGALQGSGAYGLNGFISNARVTTSSVYSANFTPTTEPLTAITNTQLLLNATNAAIFDNSMKNDLETLGNVQISTAQSKFGGSSMYFDGSGDYMMISGNKADWTWVHNGQQNWTIEFWAYNVNTNEMGVFCTNTNSINTAYGAVMGLNLMNGAGSIGGHFTRGVDGARMDWYTAGGILSANQWNHVVLQFNTTTKNMEVYLNGVSRTVTNQNVVNNSPTGGDGSAFAYSNEPPSFNPNLGRVVGGVTVGSYFNGYIDEMRITRGIRRYTANFTQPTKEFPDT